MHSNPWTSTTIFKIGVAQRPFLMNNHDFTSFHATASGGSEAATAIPQHGIICICSNRPIYSRLAGALNGTHGSMDILVHHGSFKCFFPFWVGLIMSIPVLELPQSTYP